MHTPTATTIALSELLALSHNESRETILAMAVRRAGRPFVTLRNTGAVPFPSPASAKTWYGAALAGCGDAHAQVHPKFLMAVLLARATSVFNGNSDLPNWQIPRIEFATDPFVRRSMTLNGMRMTTEYFGSGSRRVLQLVEQRLEAGQRDVVHDVLVYLVNQIVDVRAEALEARMLRAEAVAAYLGLEQRSVETLFSTPSISPTRIVKAIETGVAGKMRRSIEIEPLVQGQVRLLQPALKAAVQAENKALRMIDRIVALLY